MNSTRIVVAVFAAALWLVPGRSDAQLPQIGSNGPPRSESMATEQERKILLDFFAATGGPRWKNADGWGTASDPCLWQGIICLPVYEGGGSRMAPVWLSLVNNGLTGALPVSLLQLPRLKQLDLAQNRITAVPQEFFARADANRLELWLAGNPLPEVLVKLRLRTHNSTGMCLPNQEEDFAAEFDATGTRYQARYCMDESGGGSYCLASEPNFETRLDLLARGVRRLGWTRENQRYQSPKGPSSHEERFRATLEWGDGTIHSIDISDGQAPIDIQIGQMMMRALVWSKWTTKARRVPCGSLGW
jgi:hypothetical protein